MPVRVHLTKGLGANMAKPPSVCEDLVDSFDP